jgi:LacI family transcriptional regulator
VRGPRKGNAPTLQDVAQEAGVSCMVASVVLNGARSTTRVSEATRSKIIEAGLRLKYRRNAAALGLCRRKMNAIGVAAPFDGGELNLYVLELLNGILEATAERGQNATVLGLRNWDEDAARLLDFCDGRIDALVMIAPQLDRQLAEQIPDHLPCVTINGSCYIPGAHGINVDNRQGARIAVQHLIDLGHRDILHISGGQAVPDSVERTAGYLEAMQMAGAVVTAPRVVHSAFSIASGRRVMQGLLQGSRPMPSAVFCASDAIAVGCMEVLQEAGIAIPEQISIVGFDDTIAARLTAPPLTTIRQPFREMGHCAVLKCLDLLEEDVADFGTSTESMPDNQLFDARIVVRATTGKPGFIRP